MTTRVIGLISDTHGLVRPEVHAALSGVELILHAGDVGGDAILAELQTIAPVLAVYGNTDPPGHPLLQDSVETEIDAFGGNYSDPSQSKWTITIKQGENSLQPFELN